MWEFEISKRRLKKYENVSEYTSQCASWKFKKVKRILKKKLLQKNKEYKKPFSQALLVSLGKKKYTG